MAKHMNMVGPLFGGGLWARAPRAPPKSGAVALNVLWLMNHQKYLK